MNTGIGDAVNLSWKFAAVLQQRADFSILETYEAERIPFCALAVSVRQTSCFSASAAPAWAWGRSPIAKVVGVQVISLDEAPRGNAEFDAGAPKKFVIDPHGVVSRG